MLKELRSVFLLMGRFVGNQSGNLTEALDPQFMQDYLNKEQQAIAQ